MKELIKFKWYIKGTNNYKKSGITFAYSTFDLMKRICVEPDTQAILSFTAEQIS